MAPESAINEEEPLLSNKQIDEERVHLGRSTAIVWTGLTVLFVVGLVTAFTFGHDGFDHLPKDPRAAAEKILSSAPVIDGHIGETRSLPIHYSYSHFLRPAYPCSG